MVGINRFDVLLMSLDPTQGVEIKKTRPCIVISPDEMNQNLKSVIIAPITSMIRNYPTRIKINFDDTNGEVVLDQIRTIDKSRIIKKIGILDKNSNFLICEILTKMFSY